MSINLNIIKRWKWPVKYLVGGVNTFFITMYLKTSSLAPHTATLHTVWNMGMGNIWCVFWNEYFRSICTWEESEYMLSEAGRGKKHTATITLCGMSIQGDWEWEETCRWNTATITLSPVCATNRWYLHISGDTCWAYVQHTRGQSW